MIEAGAAPTREAELRAEIDRLRAQLAAVSPPQGLGNALRDSIDFTRMALRAISGVGVRTCDGATDCFTGDAAIAALYGIDPVQGDAGMPRSGLVANVHRGDLALLRTAPPAA